jgi:hypothetical protein
MARRRMIFRSSQSIAGAVLVGLGMFVLYQNLAGAVAWLSHVLGANGSETLGVLPAFVLAVSQGVQAHAVNHQRVLQQMFVESWPLLLVTFGGVLSREDETAQVDAESSSGA